MITHAHLVDLLRDHGRRRNIRDIRIHCLCGWISDLPNGAGQHLQHQARLIRAALHAAEGRRAVPPDPGGDPHWDNAWDEHA